LTPDEDVSDLGNGSGLGTAWTSGVGNLFGSPSVVNGVAYIGSTTGIDAFDAAGAKSCSGPPTTCQPLWTGTTVFGVGSTPAVANRILYVTAGDDKLYAFDAAGVTNCSGTPKTCLPLWTTDDLKSFHSSPVVVNGVVYVGGS